MLQLLLIQFGLTRGFSYTYPDGTNTGKISTRRDLSSGEQIQYAYDALGRLLTAQTTANSAGAPWGYRYRYSVDGTLTSKEVILGNPTAGGSFFNGMYDSNGNMIGIQMQGTLYAYDSENRLISAQITDGEERYGYDPSNKRIQKQTPNGLELHFYGINGERLGIYPVAPGDG